jgi:hypothetical protein
VEQPRDIIRGEERWDLLEGLIRNRVRVRLEFPDSPYSWITLLLAIEGDQQNPYLVVDPVPDFQRVLRAGRDPRIVLSFFSREGVPCFFSARVLAVHSQEIWTELPVEIIRTQRRAFYRVPATPGMEIVFPDAEAPGIPAGIKDYGLGGIAFYQDRGTDRLRRLVVEAELRGNRIRVPSGKEILEIPISLAVVRRITVFHPEVIRGALEFLQFSEASRSQLTRLVFEQQRQIIQKSKGSEDRPGDPLGRRNRGSSSGNLFKNNVSILMKKWYV